MSESTDRSRATEASRWFTVMTRPSITPEDLETFRAWRRDPENASAFAKVKAGWEASGGLAERPSMIAATEAALAKYPANAGGVTIAKRRFVLRPLVWVMAALLASVCGGLIAWRSLTPHFSTDVGGQRLEVLADGSRMRLNTDSRVRVEFGGRERRVVLQRGEAFFEVAHDADRPFIVAADGARVRAIGTEFDVRHKGNAVEVTLMQGRVLVRAGDGSEAALTPGESVVADHRGLSRPTPADTEAVSSWTRGRITFSGVSLRDAVAEVNRYSERKIVLEAPESVAGVLVSGQFVAGDVDSFVAGARSLYGLQVTSQTPQEIRLSPG